MRWIDHNKKINLSDEFYVMEYRWTGRCSLEAPVSKLAVRGVRAHEFMYTAPVTLIANKGKLGDVLGFGLPISFFVSDRLKQKMQEARITGLEYHPAFARTRFKHPEGKQKYWQVLVLGWGGQIPQDSLTWELETDGIRYRRFSGIKNDRLLFTASSWDGSDFFTVWPIPVDVFVTKRVASLFQEWNVGDVDLIPLSEFKLPEIEGSVVDIRVQPLTCYLPPARGEEIGEPLGIHWW